MDRSRIARFAGGAAAVAAVALGGAACPLTAGARPLPTAPRRPNK